MERENFEFEEIDLNEQKDAETIQKKTTKEIMFALEGVPLPLLGPVACLTNFIVFYKVLTTTQKRLKLVTGITSGSGQLLIRLDPQHPYFGGALCFISRAPFIAENIDRKFLKAPEGTWQRNLTEKIANAIKRNFS